MAVRNLSALQRINLKWSKKLVPVDIPLTTLANEFTAEMKGPKVCRINVPTISKPKASTNICTRRPKRIRLNLSSINTPEISPNIAPSKPRCIELAIPRIFATRILSSLSLNIPQRAHLDIGALVEPEVSPDASLSIPRHTELPISLPSQPVISAHVFLEAQLDSHQTVGVGYSKVIQCGNSRCNQRIRVWTPEDLIGKSLTLECPTCRSIFQYCVNHTDLVLDLTDWVAPFDDSISIECFLPPRLGVPKKDGKSYKTDEEGTGQASLFNSEKSEERCIHGIMRRSCSFCQKDKQTGTPKRALRSTVFDLILPILQPPLGEDFDSPIVFPPGKRPYPFQIEGIRFLIEKERALLGDEMGLGKSIQAIVALKCLFRMGKLRNGIILCPRSVLADWEKKLWEWAPEIRLVKVRGLKEERAIAWGTPAHLYLTTYETMRQDLSGSLSGSRSFEDIAKKEVDFIILDEIQKIKNPSTMITKASRMIDARTRWGLSGTPLENRVDELISIFAYIQPKLLKYEDASHLSRVKEVIRPYFLRRRKKDALPELPDKVYDEIWLDLTSMQREAYEKAEKEGIVVLNELGEAVTVQNVLALITKLKQICNLDPSSGESCKLETLFERLEAIFDEGAKALVFSQFPQKTLKPIKSSLDKFSPLIYDGTLTDSERDTIVRTFQEEEINKVLLMSVKAGGTGLTLTRASYVFHFDLWWNPSVAKQAEDRTHRIGQEKTVFVYYLLTNDTIEERIHNLLKTKTALFDQVIDDLSDNISIDKMLTEEELLGLFDIKKSKGQMKTQPRRTSGNETLASLKPIEFERLVAILYERMGYSVRLTPGTKDKGIDVYARKDSEAGRETLAIQCKHYPRGNVGVEHIRSLFGVMSSEQQISRGVLVTSGGFSSDSEEFARGKRIDLVNGMRLMGMLEKYKVSFSNL